MCKTDLIEKHFKTVRSLIFVLKLVEPLFILISDFFFQQRVLNLVQMD